MKIKTKLLFSLLVFAGIFQAHSQVIQITGKIQNAGTGNPLAGASVSVKNGTLSSLSDTDGNYSITLPAAGLVVVSFVGMIPMEKVINQAGEVNFNLSPTGQDLNEVVVVGYGRSSKRSIITAVAIVSSKTIASLPIYRIEQALQGTAPGVTVVQNSGSPGAPLTIKVRGSSTAGGSQPLYLVDGMQVPDLNFLNPSDIDNISILKDAASAAIYGSRGGSGVVLVTTKSGKRNSRQPDLSLNAYTGIQNLGHTPAVMNKDQYVTYYNQFQDLNSTPQNKISDASKAKLPSTNWYQSVFEKNAPMQNLDFSLANGGQSYSYYVSGGIFSQDGLVGGKQGKSNYKRQNLLFKFDADILKNLTIQVSGGITKNTRNYLYENQAAPGIALMNYLSAIPSVYPAFDSANSGIPFNMGDLSKPVSVNGVILPAVGAVTNPHLGLILNNNRVNGNVSTYKISGAWLPIPKLEINSSYSYYGDNSVVKSFVPTFDFRPSQNFFNNNAYLSETIYKTNYNQFEANAKYKFIATSKQSLELLVGSSVLTSAGEAKTLQGTDFLVNNFKDVNFSLIRDASTINYSIPYPAFQSSLLSFFGRVNYSFNQKYLIAASLRADASSKFGPNNRWGIFPAVSAGWILSEENFLKENKKINFLKLRASWGINGNDNINNYQYSTIFDPASGPSFGGLNSPGISVPFLPNTGVKWEQVAQTNIGIDMNAFNNSFGISVDYYNKNTSDMLLPIGTPAYTGLGSAAANVASVKNEGVELLLSYKKIKVDGFSWNVAFNYAYNKNEVTSLGENGQALNGGQIGYIFSSPITRTDLGHPIASFYGYKIKEIDAKGDFIFQNLDGKAGLTDADKTFIGSPLPKYTYGFTIGAEYKGFDVGVFLYGSHGNKIYDATVRLDASYSNRPVSYANAGAPKNILGTGGTGTNQTEVSDYYVKDGSFAKLKTLALGYSLSKSILKKMHLSKMRFYISAQNLFVITKYDGIDPEIGQANSSSVLDMGIDRGFYPQPKSILFGLQARF